MTLSSPEFESVPIPLQIQGNEVSNLEQRTFAEAVLTDEFVPFKSSSRQGKTTEKTFVHLCLIFTILQCFWVTHQWKLKLLK